MEINYIDRDNILIDTTANAVYSDNSPITSIEYDDNLSSYRITHNNCYPSFNDIVVVDSTGIITIDETEISIVPNANMTISFPLVDEKIKEFASRYFDDIDMMYDIQRSKLNILGVADSTNVIDVEIIKSVIYDTEDDPIVDYIFDPQSEFADSDVNYIYNKRLGVVQRSIYKTYSNEICMPKFLLECISTDGTVEYKVPSLDIISNLSSNSSSNLYNFNITDSTSMDTTGMVEITMLPEILATNMFRNYTREILSEYDIVNVVIYIENNTDNNILFNQTDFDYKYRSCAIAEIEFDIRDYETIKSRYNSNVVNIQMISPSIMSFYDTSLDNIKCEFEGYPLQKSYVNIEDGKLKANTTNYMDIGHIRNHIQLEYSDSTTAMFKVILIDVDDEEKFTIKDFGLTISRREKTANVKGAIFNFDSGIQILGKFGTYYFTSENYDMTTSTIAEIDYIYASNFNLNECKVQELMYADVTTALNLIDDVVVSVHLRLISDGELVFYLSFKHNMRIYYLSRFLEGDVISNIIDNLLLSLNVIDNNGEILRQLVTLDKDMYMTKYISEVDSNVTYLYRYMTNNQIININGVYDRKTISAIKDSIETPELNTLNGLYVPNDVLLINNTFKTN